MFHLPIGLFAAFGFIAVAASATNTPISFCVMAMAIMPSPDGVYAALCACAAYLLVGHRSVHASQKLGFVKAAGLSLDIGGNLGDISRGHISVRPNSVTAKIMKIGRRKPKLATPKLIGKHDDSSRNL